MPGKPATRCTIADVARLAGVSITTVSRVVNRSSLVNENTAQRVHHAIDQLGYAPETAARNLASRRTYTLGVLLPVIGTDFYALVVSGIEAEAFEKGYDLLIATQHETSGRRLALPTLGPHNTDGLLTVNVEFNDTLIDLHLEGFPLVTLYAKPPSMLNIPIVAVEDESSSYQLVSHFIEVHGYTDIGFLTGPENNEDSRWRESGYRKAMADHNLPVDEDLIHVGGFDTQTGRLAILNWHRASGHLPRAIYCGDDEAALGTVLALAELGLRIPQDVAIAGFNDSSLSAYLVPPLTTIHAPTSDVGRTAVRQMVSLIETGHADPLTILPTQFVVRNSCGCAQSRV